MGGGHTVHWLGTGHMGGGHTVHWLGTGNMGGGHTVHWLGTARAHMGGGEFQVRDSEAVLYATSHTLF